MSISKHESQTNQSFIYNIHNGLATKDCLVSNLQLLAPHHSELLNSVKYPDLLIYSPNPKYSLEDFKELYNWTSTKPYNGTNKLCIIEEAEQLTTEIQNKLLKILEEPTDNNYFILITKDYHRLLSTVISRCQVHKIISVEEISPEDKKASRAVEDLVLSFIGKEHSLSELFTLSEKIAKEENAIEIVQQLLPRLVYELTRADKEEEAREVFDIYRMWNRNKHANRLTLESIAIILLKDKF